MPLRAASVRQAQRVLGNRAAQRVVQRLIAQPIDHGRSGMRSEGHETRVQRDSLNPLDWARDLLNSVSGDAAAQEAQVSGEATARAGEVEGRSAAESAQLQSQSATQGTVLQGEAAVQGGQIGQQATAQGAALQNQSHAEGARLNSESSSRAADLQQQANGTSIRLQDDVGALDNAARSTEAAAEGALAGDAAGMQGEAEANSGLVQGQWTGLETQTTGHVTSLTNRTQTLLDQKAALVKEYQGPGAHDPERFQRRWDMLQSQIAPLEQEQSNLAGVEGSGEAINEHASTIWSNLSNRGQALLTRVSGMAGSAWNALQGRWSSLQGTAAAALSGLQGRASAAVNGFQALAAGAATRLQGAVSGAWTGLKGFATAAWTGLQGRAATASAALQSQTTAAWTALQGAAGSAVGGLADKIGGVVSRISGAVGRIVSLIAGAVESMLSRLRSATAAALNALRTRATAAWNAVKSVGARAWEGLKSLGGRAWEGLKSAGTRAWEGLKDLGTRAWEGLKSLGTRAWEGVKNLGQRAWNGLKSGWEWLKTRAQSAWTWLKGAWEKVKRTASQLWDWVKRKASDAIAWLKQKWQWLKALVGKAWNWLKAKWKWLKSLVKIKIRLPDQTLCKLHNFKPWKFVDLHSGRLPIAKTVVDPGLGPIELALFVQGDAEATIGGTVGPCTLKNITFTLQPLISRYTGQADFHIGATAAERLELTGTIGGSANYGGLIALAGGGLKGTGTSAALGSFEAKPQFVYDSGKITTSVPVRLEFCLMPTIDLEAFVVAQLLTGKPPSAAPAPTPVLPGPGPSLPGPPVPTLPGPLSSGPGATLPVPTTGGGSPTSAAPPEKILKEWKHSWHLARWSRRECWKVDARFTLIVGPGGLPEIDLEFSAAPVSLAEVIRALFDEPPGTAGGGGGGHVGPLGATYACAICKCSGDKECGGGRIHTIWMGRTECNAENKKKAQELCNHDSTFLSICDLNQKRKDGKKCSVHHHDFACSERETEDKCTNRQQGGLLEANTLKIDLQALVDARNATYSDYKTRINAADAQERTDALLDPTLLRNIQGVLARNDFAKCVELLGRSPPAATSLLADPTVSAAMSAAFTASSPAVTLPPHNPANPVGPCNPPAGTPPPAGVHEEGGWIYLNLITGHLVTRRANPGGQANIDLSGPPDVPDSIVIGTFHTHPNVGPCWGPVHASRTDTNSANGSGVPWLIIGAFPNVSAIQTTATGPTQRLHLAGNRGFPGSAGGDAPQGTIDGSFDEV
jgi:hypothetical protein